MREPLPRGTTSLAWFTREEYLKSLAPSQLAPGPLAAQLAICLGYVHSRLWGATLVSFAFAMPSFPQIGEPS